MNVSRVKAAGGKAMGFWFCLLVLAALFLGLSSPRPGFAEGDSNLSSPLRLAPPKGLGPPPQTPASSTPAPSSLGGAIQVNPLGGIEPDAAGALSANEGGFNAAMWTGASRAMVDQLLPHLPVGVASPVMRGLMRRLLLSAATPPQGAGVSGGLAALRAKLLAEMGDHAGVNKLLEVIPNRDQNDQLVRVEVGARFLANDNARACALAAERIKAGGGDYWQKAVIFCQTLAGEKQKALLGVALLRELRDEDGVFLNLAEALINKELAVINSLPDPSPLHLTMARAAKAALPLDVISSIRPGVLSAIAVSPSSSIKLRLEAAEKAEASGALPIDVLRQIYSGVAFSDADLANPLSKAEAEKGPLSRALLYRASLTQPVPTAQAEVLAAAFKIANIEGRFASAARVFLPALKRIPLSRDLAWFGRDAVRALLIGDDLAGVSSWLSLLRENAHLNKEAFAALLAFMPIARLAGLAEAKDWSVNELDAWWEAEKGKDGAGKRAELLYSLFEALGESVPLRLWEALAENPAAIMMAMPNPLLWNILVKASDIMDDKEPLVKTTKVMIGGEKLGETVDRTEIAALEKQMGDSLEMVKVTVGEERLGLTVLASLLAIGQEGPGRASPALLRQVLSALAAAGLEAEARALAVEALLAISQ